jgi:hypothetical protein
MPQRWTITDDLRLCIVMGLRKGLRLIKGMRRALTEDEQNTIANEIVTHLRLANWEIRLGEPLAGHGTGPKSKSE